MRSFIFYFNMRIGKAIFCVFFIFNPGDREGDILGKMSGYSVINSIVEGYPERRKDGIISVPMRNAPLKSAIASEENA